MLKSAQLVTLALAASITPAPNIFNASLKKLRAIFAGTPCRDRKTIAGGLVL